MGLKFLSRSNPVLETENGETCRQLLIASVASLKVLNGTEIFKTERYGAELDYWKKYGLEYLDAAKDEAKMEAFERRHPRYRRFLKVHGVPEAEELVVAKTDLKSRLLEVVVECPPLKENWKAPSKRLPPNLTVHKLRALLQRLVRTAASEKRLQAHELVLSYRSALAPDIEVPFDNEMRELSFYGLENGDAVIVNWEE